MPTLRRTFALVSAAGLAVLLVAVVVFRLWGGLTWLNSVYFVVTTMTTIGYGDISLLNMKPAVKVFGIGVQIAGALSLAALFGLVTDYIVRTRLQMLFGRGKKDMRDHIVLCGLGKVGSRVLQILREHGETVVVVERAGENRFVAEARDRGVQIVEGDMRTETTLERASVATARCLVAVSDDDLANLEVALNARRANPGIDVVLRLFDQHLAQTIQTGMSIRSAFSTSFLAAPAFAHAALDPAVIGSFYIGEQLMLTAELKVASGSALQAMTSRQVADTGLASVLFHGSANGGQQQFNPTSEISLAAGDRLVLATLPGQLRALHELNVAKS